MVVGRALLLWACAEKERHSMRTWWSGLTHLLVSLKLRDVCVFGGASRKRLETKFVLPGHLYWPIFHHL